MAEENHLLINYQIKNSLLRITTVWHNIILLFRCFIPLYHNDCIYFFVYNALYPYGHLVYIEIVSLLLFPADVFRARYN